jgi:hypothetical protein
MGSLVQTRSRAVSGLVWQAAYQGKGLAPLLTPEEERELDTVIPQNHEQS